MIIKKFCLLTILILTISNNLLSSSYWSRPFFASSSNTTQQPKPTIQGSPEVKNAYETVSSSKLLTIPQKKSQPELLKKIATEQRKEQEIRAQEQKIIQQNILTSTPTPYIAEIQAQKDLYAQPKTSTYSVIEEKPFNIIQKKSIQLSESLENSAQAVSIEKAPEKNTPSRSKKLFDTLSRKKDQAQEKILPIFDLANQFKKRFDVFIEDMALELMKKSFRLSPNSKIMQTTFAEMFVQALKKYMFQIAQLTENIDIEKRSREVNAAALLNFKRDLAYIAQQLNKYNNQNTYTNTEELLLFLEHITKFLKEIDSAHITRPISEKMDILFEQARICYNLFQNQQIIFSTLQTPEQIILLFEKSLQNTQSLSNIDLNYNILDIIYGKDGYMDQILTTWFKFQVNPLYKKASTRAYGAFITFLLIFENSIVAASLVLDQLESRYQAANQVQIIINLETNKKEAPESPLDGIFL